MNRNSQKVFDQLTSLIYDMWVPSLAGLGFGFFIATAVATVVPYVIPIDLTSKPKQEPATTLTAVDQQLQNMFTQADSKIVTDRNLFNIDGTIPKEDQQDDKRDDYDKNEPIKSNLPLVLHGTIFGGDPKSGLALIEDTQKKVFTSFMFGEMVTPQARLIEILREKVILEVGDHKEFLEVDLPVLAMRGRGAKKAAKKADDAPQYSENAPPANYKEEGFERTGTDIVVSADFRKKLLTTDFAKMLQDAKAEPNFNGAELDGFKLDRIRSDSIYEKAGLRNQDIVKEINGIPLTDAGQSIKLLNSLRGESGVEVKIQRDGKPLTITLQVKGM